jgi:lipoprotein-anchoring transpeptidase ErfK/SrfK
VRTVFLTAMRCLVFSGRKLRMFALTVSLFLSICGSGGTYAETFTEGRDVAPFTSLQNGDYVWKPEVSPAGPVLIVVSIPEQRLFVYRNGVRIGSSTVSSGRPGHPTPTGVFTILQKQVDHTSTIYKGASMPYMERLTWGGIALHAGDLPGFADSHGCVRLPLEFAKKLYTVTGKGTTVMITDGNTTPVTSGHPGYLLAAKGNEAVQKADDDDYEWNPQEAPTGPVSIVFSAKSSRVYVFRDGVEIGRAVVRGGEDLKIGIHAYTALGTVDDEGHRQWSSIDTVSDRRAPELRELAKHLSIPPAFLAQVRTVIQPGTTLVVSDAPVDRSTPIDSGVNILTTDERSK